MAQRHFYSRVPARASMYHLTDGFDTFAKSSGITREFIEIGLGRLCEYTPGKVEQDMILDGKLPPTYCMLRTAEGEVVQSCITYLPADFTGERSGFMINSLILDENEQDRLFSQNGIAYINPEMFCEKIENFDICSPSFSPVTDYPAAEYTTKPMKDISEFIKEYDERVIRRLIFALMTVTASKNKCVFIAPVMPAEELSIWGLDLINALMQIFPVHIRERIAFISFITDYKKMNCFNVKFVHADNVQVTGKGFVFDMTPNKADNIRDSDYKERESDVDFFYDLCSDKAKRDSFNLFCYEVVKKDSQYAQPNADTLSDLILLFKQSRYEGEQEENSLVANDAACLNLISTYERHRAVLRMEDRKAVLGPLIARYSRLRTPIPSNIFGKITKLYSKEPPECRVIIMDGLLALMHTDAMREKLFAFIKNNFNTETSERREIICEDLSRVFYGGFLQDQILSFFDEVFSSETEKSRTNILSKLLLSIRTEMVRDKVFAILTGHRDEMDEEQRAAIYNAMYGAIPACDITSAKAVGLLDKYAETESPVAQNEIIVELYGMLEEDEKKNAHSVADLMINDNGVKGPVTHGIIKRITQKQTKKKLFGYMVSRLAGEKFNGIYNALTLVLSFDETEPEIIDKTLYDKIGLVFDVQGKKATLDEVIQLHQKLTEASAGFRDYQKIIYDRICKEHLYVLFGEKYIQSIDMRTYPRPIDYYAGYAQALYGIPEYPGITSVIKLSRLIEFLGKGMTTEAVEAVLNLDIPSEYVQTAAYRIKSECRQVLDTETPVDTEAVLNTCVSGAYCAVYAAVTYIEKKDFELKELYEENLKAIEKRLLSDMRKAEVQPKNPKKAEAEVHDTASLKALTGFVGFCVCFCNTACDDVLRQKLFYSRASDLDYTLAEIYAKDFKNLKKEVIKLSQSVRPANAIISEKLKNDFGIKLPPKQTEPENKPVSPAAGDVKTDAKSEKSDLTPPPKKEKGFGFFKKGLFKGKK